MAGIDDGDPEIGWARGGFLERALRFPDVEAWTEGTTLRWPAVAWYGTGRRRWGLLRRVLLMMLTGIVRWNDGKEVVNFICSG